MRTLEKNKRPFYYSLKIGKQEIIDEYGNNTGEYEFVYADPIQLFGNFNRAVLSENQNIFGYMGDIDLTIILDDMSVPIDEFTKLWINQLDTSEKNDYEVKFINKSLNVVTIGVKKV